MFYYIPVIFNPQQKKTKGEAEPGLLCSADIYCILNCMVKREREDPR